MTKTETNNKLMDYIAPEFSPLGENSGVPYMCFKIMYNNLINGII